MLNKIFSICTGDVVTESMDMTHLVVFMRKKSEIDFFKETAAVKKNLRHVTVIMALEYVTQ